MKRLFQYSFIILSMTAYYICSALYIAAHVIFNGNLQYDRNFINYDYTTYEENEDEILIVVYPSIAHKWLGIIKLQRRIPKQDNGYTTGAHYKSHLEG